MRKPREEHKLSRHPLYRVWQGMKQRCYCKTCRLYPYYGAKGVTVCDEWLNSPVAFIQWALTHGWEQGLEIDKDILKEGNKIYSPATCKFVSHSENQRKVMSYKLKERSKKVKLNLEDISYIISAKLKGVKTRELAGEFKVSVQTINRVYAKYRQGKLQTLLDHLKQYYSN